SGKKVSGLAERLMTWYHMYQQIRVPRPGTLTLMRRGSLKRKSKVQTSLLSTEDIDDLISRSLKPNWPAAGASHRASTGSSAASRVRPPRRRVLPQCLRMTSPPTVRQTDRRP